MTTLRSNELEFEYGSFIDIEDLQLRDRIQINLKDVIHYKAVRRY